MTAIENLLQVMADLRDPQHGCPWDIRQNSLSIAPHTLDETHELIDAIERDDTDNIKEELGDLLFNIVFHARIAEEQGAFDFNAVAQGITDKMLRRHPHVFGDARDQQWSEAELAEQWQALKQEEKQQAKEQARKQAREQAPENAQQQPASDNPADGDSSANSPIYRARQIQQQAAELGFDWPDIRPVFAKLEEELGELKEAFASGDKHAISDELGDLMFVCVNLARHARVNAEMSLRQTNRKFQRRFTYVRQQMGAAGIAMEQHQLEQMERFWQESKRHVDEVRDDSRTA